MPLVYHALESDNPVVLEKALKVVPGLCESLDYTVCQTFFFSKLYQLLLLERKTDDVEMIRV